MILQKLKNAALKVLEFPGRAVAAVVNFAAEQTHKHPRLTSAILWGSLFIASAALLTFALWPAALAAAVGVTVAGVSIAGLTSSTIGQVAILTGLAFVGSNVVLGAGAALVNSAKALFSHFTNRNQPKVVQPVKIKVTTTAEEELKRLEAEQAAKTAQAKAAVVKTIEKPEPETTSTPVGSLTR